MQRTKFNNNQEPSGFDVMSATIARAALANVLGVSHGGTRNLYKAFGYPTSIGYDDYQKRYKRQDMAKAVIKRPASATWAGDITVREVGDAKDTEFEKKFEKLQERLRLKSKFARLDRLTSLGKFGILLLGFSDCKNTSDFQKEVKDDNSLDLLYVKPVGEGSTQISKYESNVSSERYGLPLLYSITLKGVDGSNTTKTLTVHHSRVIHVAWDLMEDENEGTPILEAIYNRLMDLEKLVGGSAEMFWRGARPGYQGEIDPDYTMGPDDKKLLKEHVQEFENGLRRMFIHQGVKLHDLSPQVEDPLNHIKAQVQMISSVTGIPQRVLLGAEQGELASGQDADAWKTLIQDRRLEQIEPSIVRPFIDRLVKYKVLPRPKTGAYTVIWSDLFAPSEKERAEIGKTRAAAIQQYLQNPMAPEIIPPKLFFEFMMGFSKEQRQLAEKLLAEGVSEEEQFAKLMREQQRQQEQNDDV